MPAVTCPNCNGRTQVEDRYMGWQVRCPHCSAEFTAGGAAAPPAPPPTGGFAGYPQAAGPGGGYDPGEWAQNAARDRVANAALWLKVVGWWRVVTSVLVGLLYLLLGVVALNAPGGNDPEEAIVQIVGGLLGAIFGVGTGLLILYGAGKMARLESHGWGMSAAIIAVIPCFNVCCVESIAPGILALIALNDPLVREAFHRSAAGDPRRYADY